MCVSKVKTGKMQKVAVFASLILFVSLIIYYNPNISNATSSNTTSSEISNSVSANVISTFFYAFLLLIEETGVSILIFVIIAFPLFVKPISVGFKSKQNKQNMEFESELKNYTSTFKNNQKSNTYPIDIIQNDKNALFNLLSHIIVTMCCFILIANATRVMFTFDIIQYFQVSQTLSLVIGIGARDLFTNVLLGISSIGTIHVGSFIELNPNYSLQPLSGWILHNKDTKVQLCVVHRVAFTGVYILLIPFQGNDCPHHDSEPNWYRLQFLEYTRLYASCTLVQRFENENNMT